MRFWKHVICLREVAEMRRKPYCCEASRGMYEDYYSRQSGGEMPVFVGARRQRGHGLGSILGGILRGTVLPFVKTKGKALAADALKTGMEVAGDVMGGKSLAESAKHRVPAAVKRVVGWSSEPESIKRVANPSARQFASSIGGRRKQQPKKKKKKRIRDIFS